MNVSTDLLTDDDRKLIENFIEKPNLKLLIFMVFFTALSYLGSIFLDTFLPLIIFAILSIAVAIWYFWMKINIEKLLHSGTKKIISGMIENKYEKRVSGKKTKKFSSSNYTFGYITIDGTDFLIPYDDFSRINVGEKVSLHLTIADDIVFKITK